MAYLIARKRESHGCLALKIKHGENLVELKRRLNKAVGYKGIELITISRPTAYVEYAPYLKSVYLIATRDLRISGCNFF